MELKKEKLHGCDKKNDAAAIEKMDPLLNAHPGGAILPCVTRQEWEQLLTSTQPEYRELLVELARFADLWRYFEEHEERLGRTVVRDIGRLHKLALSERVVQLKKINGRLMRRVGNAGESPQFRQ
jgi:hypothetical protein